MHAESLADAWPLSVAKHVDKIQVGRNERLERASGRQGSMVPRQWQRLSQATSKLMLH